MVPSGPGAFHGDAECNRWRKESQEMGGRGGEEQGRRGRGSRRCWSRSSGGEKAVGPPRSCRTWQNRVEISDGVVRRGAAGEVRTEERGGCEGGGMGGGLA